MAGSIDQLKARIRNLAKGDSAKSQILLRHYGVERFLIRLAASPYRDNFVIKGGTLVAAKIGLEHRSTMDLDATLKGIPLSEDETLKIVGEITAITLEDGIAFRIKSVKTIMEESDYPGIRIMMDASMGKTLIPIKIDFSTDDVITPHAVLFPLPLMFEDRTIPLLAYNTETVLAEKLETIVSRGIFNTRMRDFYDIYALDIAEGDAIDYRLLEEAFDNTSRKRNTDISDETVDLILVEIGESETMKHLWGKYQQDFNYAEGVGWDAVTSAVEQMMARMKMHEGSFASRRESDT